MRNKRQEIVTNPQHNDCFVVVVVVIAVNVRKNDEPMSLRQCLQVFRQCFCSIWQCLDERQCGVAVCSLICVCVGCMSMHVC